MKKLVIAVVVAVVLIAGGLGSFAYVQANPLHEPMTGQKLVGHGFYGWHYDDEDDVTGGVDTMFTFTNPDCVSEITIDGVFILDGNGNVLYEGGLKWHDDILEPHEMNGIELQEYIGVWVKPLTPVTVEIFWTWTDKKGLPLTGRQLFMMYMADGEVEFGDTETLIENLIGMTGSESQMVNMEQKLKPKD